VTALAPTVLAAVRAEYADCAVDPLSAAAADLRNFHRRGVCPEVFEVLSRLGLVGTTSRGSGYVTNAGQAVLEASRW
jgi:hypothetical protein